MTEPDLAQKHCLPCEAGTLPMSDEVATEYLPLVPHWELRDGRWIRRRFRFPGFRSAVAFVNRIADLAEEEGHHPDFRINFNRVVVDLTTHAIGGLSENDLIMASKIDRLYEQGVTGPTPPS